MFYWDAASLRVGETPQRRGRCNPEPSDLAGREGPFLQEVEGLAGGSVDHLPDVGGAPHREVAGGKMWAIIRIGGGFGRQSHDSSLRRRPPKKQKRTGASLPAGFTESFGDRAPLWLGNYRSTATTSSLRYSSPQLGLHRMLLSIRHNLIKAEASRVRHKPSSGCSKAEFSPIVRTPPPLARPGFQIAISGRGRAGHVAPCCKELPPAVAKGRKSLIFVASVMQHGRPPRVGGVIS